MKKHQTILVVEDDLWFAQQHLRRLEAAGFTAKHVTDGMSGIAAIDDEIPDAMVLDLFLPGPNALALLHEMKSYSDLSRIPVIVCTSSTTMLSMEKLAPYGVVAIVDKVTMKPDDVVRAVRKALI